MSWQPCDQPLCQERPAGFRTIVASRSRDLGGFSVRRVLPAPAVRHVGPFIFFDEMGPALLGEGEGIDGEGRVNVEVGCKHGPRR